MKTFSIDRNSSDDKIKNDTQNHETNEKAVEWMPFYGIFIRFVILIVGEHYFLGEKLGKRYM
jgi:hypothetical protein